MFLQQQLSIIEIQAISSGAQPHKTYFNQLQSIFFPPENNTYSFTKLNLSESKRVTHTEMSCLLCNSCSKQIFHDLEMPIWNFHRCGVCCIALLALHSWGQLFQSHGLNVFIVFFLQLIRKPMGATLDAFCVVYFTR